MFWWGRKVLTCEPRGHIKHAANNCTAMVPEVRIRMRKSVIFVLHEEFHRQVAFYPFQSHLAKCISYNNISISTAKMAG